ncbi:hypothetical protein PG987_008159 [Apiospora arundinis]
MASPPSFRIIESAPPKPFILKRSLHDDDLFQILNEIKTLRILRGAAHIVQLMDGCDRNFDDPNLPGPSIAMEYLENGSFGAFLQRCITAQVRLPNRVLWCIILCLIRANVAMTWPPRGKELDPEKLETVSQRTAPTPYAHNDLHLENIMFGNMDPDVAEHSMFPRLKLIDFVAADLRAAAVLRLGLRDRRNPPVVGEQRRELPLARPIAAATHWPNDGPLLSGPPRLEEILETAVQAVFTKSEADYPGYEQEESDAAIAEFVRNFFFDAPGGSSDASDGNPDEW